MKDTLISSAILLALLALSFFLGRWTKPRERIIIPQRDTIIIRDTIRHEKPIYISQRVTDTLYVPVTDTIRRSDTAYVVLPRSQKEYSSQEYRAWVSGYEPRLDSIDVFRQTVYIPTPIKEPPKRWHLGVTAGYGASTSGLVPFVGVGITYSLLSF